MSNKNGTSADKPATDTLREEIKQTRVELGETVQALAAKADVKARAKDQVEQTKQKVKAQVAGATGKVLEAASMAGDRVRAAADQAKDSAAQATDKVKEISPRDLAHEAEEQVRGDPMSLVLVFAGVAAIVGVILIARGRRR